MNIRKLADAYCYLELKGMNKFEEKVLKMLWASDKQHLRLFGSTVSGYELPITELPQQLPIEKCESCGLLRRIEKPCIYGPFGELSRSNMIMMDHVFLEFEEMTEDQIADFKIHHFASLEEVFEGREYAEEIIQEIRENAKLREFFGEIE